MEGTVWNEGTTRKGCIDSMKLSARNTLKGTITAIHPGAVNAIVIMELEGGQLITSTISMGSLKELELAGYIIRRQLRGKDGRISDTEYTIFEKPRKPSPPDTTLPDTENPYLDNPDTEAPDTDNPAQLNTKKSNTQKSNTDLSSTHSFFLPAADGMTDGFEKKAEIREQIEYDILCQQYDRMQLDELVEIMLEVAMNRSPTVKIGRDAEYPTGFVQQRFEKITSMHIEKVMDGIRENTTRVWNTKAYLMAALFNSVSTIDNHYAMLVNHDFHGGP